MKKIVNILLSAALVSSAASCTKEIEQEVIPEGTGFTVLTAHSDNNVFSRTSLDGVTVIWNSSDKITAFDNAGKAYTSTETKLQDDDGTIVKFTVPTENPAYAVYPAYAQGEEVEMAEGKILTTIPTRQNGIPGSFDDGANVEIAKIVDPDDIHFKNVGGLLAVKIVATSHTINSIKILSDQNMTGDILTSIDAEGAINTSFATAEGAEVANFVDITGEFEAGNTYYAVVAPGTYTNVSIVFTDEDGKTATYTKKTELVVERNANLLIGGFSPDSRWSVPVTSKYYVKVEDTDGLLNGTYLIVYEGGKTSDNSEVPAVAFNGSLETLDAIDNAIDVNIVVEGNDNKILSTDEVDAASFTISVDDGTIKTSKGDFIGVASNTNSLKQGEEATYKIHSFNIDDNGNAMIVVSDVADNMTLRYNYASNQLRFRYYKNAGQQPVALYLLEGSGTPLKPLAELSFDASEVEVTMGETFTAPTLTTNPSGIEVSYSSSTTAVATVDETTGKVSIVSPGTTTITASFAGNDSYRAASASYILKVNSNVDNGDGTLENPFNVAGAYEYINNSGSEKVYIKGIISKVEEGKEFSESYGTAVFWISDDGTEDVDQFEAYSVYFLGNRSWKEGNTQIQVGDDVILYGEVTKYNTTYETSSKKAYVYSLNDVSTILDAPDVETDCNNTDKTITVSWESVTGATSYKVICGETEYIPALSETSHTFTVTDYGSYSVRVIAYGSGVEPGVSVSSATLVDPTVSTTTVEFTGNTSGGMTTDRGEQTGKIGDVTVIVKDGLTSSDQIRIYKNSTITISVPEDKAISKVEFTCTASGTSQYGPGCFSSITGYSYNGSTGIWEGSSSSITLTASSNQVRATSIKVTYSSKSN